MSFVTVFTATTMGFVLFVPVLMVWVLTPLSPLRASLPDALSDALPEASDDTVEHADEPAELIPAA
jgi:hypothetical protein